ncbi:MAG: NnrS family protein, partial [Sneathiella sp.]|nr:NnrS family protein [Sneathiella sp.]
MQNNTGSLLFEGGFRIFFLGAATYAVLTMALWSLQMSGSLEILEQTVSMPLTLWHAHELIFGFIVAVVAGFLTTAVPVWANTPRIRGTELKVLFGLWLLGRVAVNFSAVIPLEIGAIIDVLFIPALVFSIAKPIIRKKLWKNLGFIPLLLLLMTGNILIHLEVLELSSDTAGPGIDLSIGLLVLMTIVIGGRVTPFFTQNWLKRHGIQEEIAQPDWITKVVIVASLITVIANAFSDDVPL